MRTALVDIETTAIGPNRELPDRIHNIVIREYESGDRLVFREGQIKQAMKVLNRADRVVAHYGLGFDFLVMKKHGFAPKGELLDTLVLSYMFESDIKERYDYERAEYDKKKKSPWDKTRFTGDLIGSHGLEAWGLRFNFPKGSYAKDMEKKGLDPWAEWNQEMEDYCIQDVDVMYKLYDRLVKVRNIFAPQYEYAIVLEHEIQRIMVELEQNGIYFDVDKAKELAGELEEIVPEVMGEVLRDFPEKYEPQKWVEMPPPPERYDPEEKAEIAKIDKKWAKFNEHSVGFNGAPPEYVGEVTVPKRTAGERTKGAGYCRIVKREFNPKSRPQIVRRLRAMGWEPKEFTEKGAPSVADDVLITLKEQFPVAKSLARLSLVNKRLGQVLTGDKAWFKSVGSDGLIHPLIRPCATITHRATHSNPNMSQVPALKFGKVIDEETGEEKNVVLHGEDGEWGHECRAIFGPPPASYTGGVQWVQVGTDLSGLELRCFGHYLEPYDGGAFIKILLTEDVHANNQRIMGLANRTDAKRVIFALLYGAGDVKIGSIVHPHDNERYQAKKGRMYRNRLMKGIVGFNRMNRDLRATAVKEQYLQIIDGRVVPVRAAYAALNTLLQSTGSILAKAWILNTIIALEDDYGLKCGYDGDFVLMLWSHDEMQFAVHPKHAELVARVAEEQAVMTGEELSFVPPLVAESDIGVNWAECH